MEPWKQAGFSIDNASIKPPHNAQRLAFSMAPQGKCRWRDSDQQSWLQTGENVAGRCMLQT